MLCANSPARHEFSVTSPSISVPLGIAEANLGTTGSDLGADRATATQVVLTPLVAHVAQLGPRHRELVMCITSCQKDGPRCVPRA